jgi:nitrate reductase gamma subunit
MNLRYIIPLIAVIVLFFIAYLGAQVPGLRYVFGVVIPYLALITFVLGFAYRVIDWSRSAVPFKIPTTGGQQKSLPWVEHSKFDCPANSWQVVVRMALEILTFRSLFRNTRMKLKEGGRISYQLEFFLWVGALAFHYAFLVVLIRHLRFFIEPVPFVVQLIENVDSFFRMEIIYPVFKFGLPGVFASGFVLLAAVSYLFLRRLFVRQVKYISIASDYFPLFLIFGTHHGAGHLSADDSGRGRCRVFCSYLFCQHPAGLFSVQQIDALRWSLPESDTQYDHRYPCQAAHQSLELSGTGAYL